MVIIDIAPPDLYDGHGCRRDTPKELILDAIQQSLAAHKLSPKSLVTAASVIVKQDEVGLLEAMQIMGVAYRILYTGRDGTTH